MSVPRRKPNSIRSGVIAVLSRLTPHDSADDDFMTAAQIHGKMRRVKLSSLSSILCKMVKSGELARHKGVGPRGGYGYRLQSSGDLYAELSRRMAESIALEIDRRILAELGLTT